MSEVNNFSVTCTDLLTPRDEDLSLLPRPLHLTPDSLIQRYYGSIIESNLMKLDKPFLKEKKILKELLSPTPNPISLCRLAAPYLNPNERKVNQRIKSDVCANRFYEHIEDQKAAISEYLDKRFGRYE